MRLAETFQATHDAVYRVVAPIVSKRPPRIRQPWYLLPEGRKHREGLTPETGLDDAIAGFARRTGRSFASDPSGRVVTVAPKAGRPH